MVGGPTTDSTMTASSAGVRTVLLDLGSMGVSAVSARLRHFRTVLTLRPYWLARRQAGAVVKNACHLGIMHLPPDRPVLSLHHHTPGT